MPPPDGSVRRARREAATARMADHVLAHGLAASGLRALAAAAGTSDRMLLYYFATKEEILSTVLGTIARRLLAALDAAVPEGERLGEAELLARLLEALEAPALKPFMAVWLELAAASARGVEPHRSIGGAIADGFLAWLGTRLDSEDRQAPARVLLTLEGCALLAALGRPVAPDGTCANPAAS
ncbi:TetR family transcriptional regulator [Thermaurantiacus sp.]